MKGGRLPLVVAVTGHTDLRDEDIGPLTTRVRGLLAGLRDRYPHTSIELMSSLAEGADRLAARAALDLGMPLVVPLPLPPADYRNDFTDGGSVDEFDRLCRAAASVFVVTAGDGAPDSRPECYARVGAYAVRHAHLLMALWDGDSIAKPGGTSEVVTFKLEGVPARYVGFTRLLDPLDVGPVVQVITPRRSAPLPEGAYSIRWHAPVREGSGRGPEAQFEAIASATEAFNATAEQSTPGDVSRQRRAAQELMADVEPGIAADLQPIAHVFGVADELAFRFQGKARTAIRLLFWLAFLGIAAFEAYAHLGLDFAVGPYILLTVALFGLYRWVTARGWDNKHLHFRALAEGLRVQFYWQLAGVRSSAADYYMRYRIDELEWIRVALRAYERRSDDAKPATASASSRIDLVIRQWVDGQRAFFTRTGERDERHLERREMQARWLFGLGLGTAGVFVALGIARQTGVWTVSDGLNHAVMVTAAVLTAGSAMVHGYIEKLALAAQTKRYVRMLGLFRGARRRLGGPNDPPRDEIEAVLVELGREALEENADWVMLHRDRPLAVPK
jgi:hypothetical protein